MQTLFLAIRILIVSSAPCVFVDQADDGIASVSLCGDTEGDFFTVPTSALPECATEGSIVNGPARTVSAPWAPGQTSDDFRRCSVPNDDAGWCPATSPAHTALTADVTL